MEDEIRAWSEDELPQEIRPEPHPSINEYQQLLSKGAKRRKKKLLLELGLITPKNGKSKGRKKKASSDHSEPPPPIPLLPSLSTQCIVNRNNVIRREAEQVLDIGSLMGLQYDGRENQLVATVIAMEEADARQRRGARR
ncbi:hypothetical protein U1Q18_052436 [Sarracenia purpurea var. burkii]